MALSSTVKLLTAADWKQQILEDIELCAVTAGVAAPPTYRGSDFDLKATALGNALSVLTANQVITDADSDPTRAEGAALDEIRVSLGLPEVPASAASGRVSVTSTALAGVTIVDQTGLMCPGSMPAKTVGTVTGVVTGTEIPIVMTTTGPAGNLAAGTIVRFTAPPPGISPDATVVAALTGGADVESSAKKRRRILNRLQTRPAGGNWGHLREVALGATNAIDNAFVYPALGGCGSSKTALSTDWFNGGAGQSRVCSAAAIACVSSAYATEFASDDCLYHVESVANEYVDLRLNLRLNPGASTWIDPVPWPDVSAVTGTVTDQTTFHVVCSAAPSVAPAVGKTIAVWSVADLGFRTAVIQTASTVTATEFHITVAGWSGGAITTFAAGMQVCAAAGNMTAWADALLATFGLQTPGECALASQLPRSLRHPFPSTTEPAGFGARELGAFISQFDEISDAEVATINVSQPTGVTPGVQPNVLCLRSLSLGQLQ